MVWDIQTMYKTQARACKNYPPCRPYFYVLPLLLRFCCFCCFLLRSTCVHYFNPHVRIGQISRILLFNLTFFSTLVQPPKIVVICHQNLTINTIDEQCPLCRPFSLFFFFGMGCGLPAPPPVSSYIPTKNHKLFLRRQRSRSQMFIVIWWRFLVYQIQQVVVLVRKNGLYLVIHGESDPDELHILSSINYFFGYLFGAC